MTERVFFYGLFMDPDVLSDCGLCATNIAPAYVDGYQLRIGERATLVAQKGGRCYGVVTTLDNKELKSLYSSPGVEDYLPQSMQAYITDGSRVDVVSYVLPQNKLDGSNRKYARALAEVAQKLKLPEHYVNEIITWT